MSWKLPTEFFIIEKSCPFPKSEILIWNFVNYFDHKNGVYSIFCTEIDLAFVFLLNSIFPNAVPEGGIIANCPVRVMSSCITDVIL
jgi:hypothetical protein